MKKKIILIICLCLGINGFALAAREITNDFTTEYRKVAFTTLAAATCAGTYVPQGQASEYSFLKHYGFKITPYSQTVKGVQLNFMVATNSTPVSGRRLAIIAFRGSQGKDDWKINLKTHQVPFGEGTVAKKEEQDVPKVHAGFDAYTKAALTCKIDLDGDGITDDLAATLKEQSDLDVLLTGHSLGGAVATLYGEHLVTQGVPKERVPVITFGAPAVGNKAFAELYGPKINLLRIVTTYDPVPGSLQSFIGGYKQFGSLERYELSSIYADFQHPISFYLDLALKNYYDIVDEGTVAGVFPELPSSRYTEGVPLVALALTAMDNHGDGRFAPDIKRFTLEEYLNVLPSYTILADDIDKNKENVSIATLLTQAKRQKAQYLVVMDVDRHSIGQSNRWYIGVSQVIFSVADGNLLVAESGSTRINYNQGIVQGTISLVEKCKESMLGQFPFAKTVVIPMRKMD